MDLDLLLNILISSISFLFSEIFCWFKAINSSTFESTSSFESISTSSTAISTGFSILSGILSKFTSGSAISFTTVASIVASSATC